MARQAPPDSAALTPSWRKQIVACNLCGSTDFVERYPSSLPAQTELSELFACTTSAYGFCEAIVQCVRCGLLFQNPQPVPEDLLSVYGQVADERYDHEREGRIHTFRRSLAELEAHASSGRLLDVGSHLGFFVEVARGRGWDAEGIEPSQWAAETAQHRGLPVRCASLDATESAGEYDAVTLWDVIEHLTDPLGSLRRVHELLTPGGVLALSTMDVDAAVARLLGRRWPWYMQMHLYYFSRRTLKLLVERSGFEVLEIRHHQRIVRVAYLVSRLERRLGRLHGLLDGVVQSLGIGNRLVGVDLGDIVTLFARKPGLAPAAPVHNGLHP